MSVRLPRIRYATWQDGLLDIAQILQSWLRGESLPRRWNDHATDLLSANAAGIDPPDLKPFIGDIYAWHFHSQQVQSVQVSLQLPHTYAQTTAIYPHLHWSPTATPTAGAVVRWCIEYTSANPPRIDSKGNPIAGEVFGSSTTQCVNHTLSGVVSHQHLVTNFPVIEDVDRKISNILAARIYREANHSDDTYDTYAVGLSFDVHIELDTDRGSTQRTNSKE